MKNAVKNRLPPHAREAIRAYLSNQAKKKAVSTFDTISQVRKQFPALETSDAVLADCIAGTAISLDLTIAFDSRALAKLQQPSAKPLRSTMPPSPAKTTPSQGGRTEASVVGG